MTTEEFAQYKSDRAQALKVASKAREKGNVTEAKAEETESESEAEEKADDASTKNSNIKTNPPLASRSYKDITCILCHSSSKLLIIAGKQPRTAGCFRTVHEYSVYRDGRRRPLPPPVPTGRELAGIA